MPHSLYPEFNLVRTYFLEKENLIISLAQIETIRVVGTSVRFMTGKKVVGIVDFFSKELALQEFNDIVSTLNQCVFWRKKND